jgi:acyl-CoA oxidase
VKHNWTRDEFIDANELISEPGPYGLHSSMYLVSLAGDNIELLAKQFLDYAA